MLTPEAIHLGVVRCTGRAVTSRHVRGVLVRQEISSESCQTGSSSASVQGQQRTSRKPYLLRHHDIGNGWVAGLTSNVEGDQVMSFKTMFACGQPREEPESAPLRHAAEPYPE